jgi:hypothetical protein
VHAEGCIVCASYVHFYFLFSSERVHPLPPSYGYVDECHMHAIEIRCSTAKACQHMHSTQHTDPPPHGNCSAHSTTSSFAVPSRAASYSRLWPEGRSCTHHSNSMATCSPASVVSENQHEKASISKTPQDSMHAWGACTHSNAFSKTTLHAGYAVQSK